jgi:hypothetical protein
MKAKETLDGIKASLGGDDTPIVWLDGSRPSFLLVQLLQLARKGSPVLIFPAFLSKALLSQVTGFAAKLDIRAYFLSPVKAISDGKSIDTEFRTNVCKASFRQSYDERFFEKLVTFEGEAKLVPAYLWSRTFIAGRLDNYFSQGGADFPLTDWTDADFAIAYEMLQTPIPAGQFPQMFGEHDEQWLTPMQPN